MLATGKDSRPASFRPQAGAGYRSIVNLKRNSRWPLLAAGRHSRL